MSKEKELVDLESKIEKVRRLAERGVGGEKTSAKERLVELVEKYNKLKKESIVMQEFPVRDFEDSMNICLQCILSVVPRAEVKRSMDGARRLYADMTNEQAELVRKKYVKYWNMWLKEKHKYLKKFIIDHNIGVFHAK